MQFTEYVCPTREKKPQTRAEAASRNVTVFYLGEDRAVSKVIKHSPNFGE